MCPTLKGHSGDSGHDLSRKIHGFSPPTWPLSKIGLYPTQTHPGPWDSMVCTLNCHSGHLSPSGRVSCQPCLLKVKLDAGALGSKTRILNKSFQPGAAKSHSNFKSAEVVRAQQEVTSSPVPQSLVKYGSSSSRASGHMLRGQLGQVLHDLRG